MSGTGGGGDTHAFAESKPTASEAAVYLGALRAHFAGAMPVERQSSYLSAVSDALGRGTESDCDSTGAAAAPTVKQLVAVLNTPERRHAWLADGLFLGCENGLISPPVVATFEKAALALDVRSDVVNNLVRNVPVSSPVVVASRRRDDFVLSGLMDSYGIHGGLASPEEVISLMRPGWRQPIPVLAKWIIGRNVVSFTWRSQILLPMFQFERPRMTPHPGIADAAAEFADLLDDPGLAAWFVRPDEWLRRAMPLDLVESERRAVVGSARCTRLALMARRLSDPTPTCAPS